MSNVIFSIFAPVETQRKDGSAVVEGRRDGGQEPAGADGRIPLLLGGGDSDTT